MTLVISLAFAEATILKIRSRNPNHVSELISKSKTNWVLKISVELWYSVFDRLFTTSRLYKGKIGVLSSQIPVIFHIINFMNLLLSFWDFPCSMNWKHLWNTNRMNSITKRTSTQQKLARNGSMYVRFANIFQRSLKVLYEIFQNGRHFFRAPPAFPFDASISMECFCQILKAEIGWFFFHCNFLSIPEVTLDIHVIFLTCRWINYSHWKTCTKLGNNANTLLIAWMIYRI